MEVASGMHRFGSRFVNWYVAEQAGVLLPGHGEPWGDGVAAHRPATGVT
jgi:hypothetical protein